MLLASQDKRRMNARGSSDSERQNLLERLLDAVKQCQVRFGGKTELATDTDSRVSCLLAQLLAIFGHGLKKPKGTIRAFMQVGQVAGITKQQELEPDFYVFIKEHLNKNEMERFAGLQHINTDAGRGRAWLRSTLNEHTLEKSIHNILSDKTLIRSYYEPHAFLLDEEKSSMLPMIAAGVSSILFALGIDKEELNAVKQVTPQLPSTKDVFSNLLSSFPASKPKEDPAAILAVTPSNKEAKKKKKKKKSAAIVSIDDIDSSREDLHTDSHENQQTFPISDSNFQTSYSKKTTKIGHSRSSSYPGKIKLDVEDVASTNEAISNGFSREMSLSDDSISKWTENNSAELYNKIVASGLSKCTTYAQSVETIEEQDEKHIESTASHVSDEQNVESHEESTLVSNNTFKDNLTDFISHENTTEQTSLPIESKDENLTEILSHENITLQSGIPKESEKESSIFSFKSLISRKPLSSFKGYNEENPGTSKDKNDENLDTSGSKDELDLLSSSVSKESESLLLMGGDNGLLPISDNKTQEKSESSSREYFEDGEEDRNSSKDSVSLSSNSWFDDGDDRLDQSEDDLMRARSESMSAATDAAAAALELCSPSQLDPMASVSMNQRKTNDKVHDDVKSQEESMSQSELKQAIVSMMLRKDEIEDQNRVLHQLLEEKRNEKEVMQTEMEQLTEESKNKEEQSVAQIAALTRENEVLKHQLKKYVGAVQMLRSSMNDPSSANTQALAGIRQDETIPTLPEQQHNEDLDSANEAKEYKQKLIQVAEMHGELMEFNERLQLQYNYWQAQALRLQDELINLRGPLPDDCRAKATTNVFDPLTAVAVTSRPLINVWIPSVFLKGKGSASVHHLYQVYVRIKDDEWNVYRRYSQFHELHKKFYKKHKIVETFKFPSKKTFGNRGTKFVEERRKALQEYIRHVVNLLISTESDFTSNTCKAALLEAMPFFGDPYPPKQPSKKSSIKRKNTQPYDGL